jgi:hypothetical protein
MTRQFIAPRNARQESDPGRPSGRRGADTSGRLRRGLRGRRTPELRFVALAAVVLAGLLGVGAAAGTTSWQGLEWAHAEHAGLTVSQTSTALTFQYPGAYPTGDSFPSGDYGSRCTVSGVFDLTVDYSFPAGVGFNSGIRAGIQVFDPQSGRSIAAVYRWNQGYIAHTDGALDTNATGDATAGTFEIKRETTSGTMRILRSDATTGGVAQTIAFRPDFNRAALVLDVFTYAAAPYPTNISQGPPPQPPLTFSNVRLNSGSCVYPKQDQTISFVAPTELSYASPATELGATATSGLPVAYSSSTPSVCTIDPDNRLRAVSVGTCTVTAAQAGDDDYDAAVSVTRQFPIERALLSIDADEQVRTYGDPTPPLTYALRGFAAGEDAGSANVTGTAACSLAAAAGPDAGAYPGAIGCTAGTLAASNYTFAAGATGALTILKAQQTIAFDQPTDANVGDPDVDLRATATSGLPVSFDSSTPGICTIVEGRLHAVSEGSCTVGAGQGGNENYEAAPVVTRTLTIVGIAATTTLVTSSANPSVLNASVGFVASVSAAGGTPTGTVQWQVDGVDVGSPVALDSTGKAAYTTSSLTLTGADAHTVTAAYSGASAFRPSAGTLMQRVGYARAGTCGGGEGHQILQPVDADGWSVFKGGSTVAAKFRVCDANGLSIGTPGLVTCFRLTERVHGTVVDYVDETVTSTTPDVAFRWDAAAQQWVFNISTKGMSTGYTYRYAIELDDGSELAFRFGLR